MMKRMFLSENGYLLFVFLLFLIVAAMAVGTAVRDVTTIDAARRSVGTEEKMKRIAHDIGVHAQQIDNEYGAEISYVNMLGSFPGTVDDMDSEGFLCLNYGLESTLYEDGFDLYGQNYAMGESSGRFTLDSTASAYAGASYDLSEGTYTNITVRIQLLRQDGITPLDPPAIDASRVHLICYGAIVRSVTGTSEGNGIYVFNGVSAGRWELNVYQGGSLFMDSFGADYVTYPVIVSPTRDSGKILQSIRLPVKSWWDTDWHARRKVMFDTSAISEDLQQFPILIRLQDPANIDFDKTMDNGYDLRFVDSDDRTVLPYERDENWDESGEMTVWVQVPQINANSTNDYIYMYYDNSSAVDGQNAAGVWDDSFVGVWHLKGEVAGAAGDGIYTDSTGTVTGDDYISSTDMDGMIWPGHGFDGSDDYIAMPSTGAASSFSFDTGESVTLECWAKRASASSAWMTLVSRASGATVSAERNYYFQFSKSDGALGSNDNRLLFGFNASSDQRYLMYETTERYNDTGSFYYCVATHTFGTVADTNIYVNGAVATANWIKGDNGAEAPVLGAGNVQIGTNDDFYANPFYGNIDEVRISHTVRSADWVAAQYASVDGTFASFGAEETQGT